VIISVRFDQGQIIIAHLLFGILFIPDDYYNLALAECLFEEKD
jgi:hypothetical protein